MQHVENELYLNCTVIIIIKYVYFPFFIPKNELVHIVLQRGFDALLALTMSPAVGNTLTLGTSL